MASGITTPKRSLARAHCRRHAFARNASNGHLGAEVRGRSPRSSPMPYGSHRAAMDVVVGRYYDPQTGQFLSVDPELEQTQQAYAYTQDDPVNTVDPSGRVTVPPGAVTAAKAAYAAGFRALLVDMVAIAGAESGWEPYVTNGRYFGLWQLDIVTFSQPLYPGSKTILCRGITSDWRKPDANARCAFNLTIFNRDNGFPVFSQWYDPNVVDGHKQVNKTATAPGCGDKVCYVIAEAAAKRAGH